MKVLIVKTSSMGDVLHTLPALTDAQNALPGIRFDWVVEEGFAQIPSWHTAVDKVLPVAIRRWRKAWFTTPIKAERLAFRQAIQAENYDAIIDAQGLLKSAALVTRLARGDKHGMDWQSAREPLASLFYNHRHRIEKNQHAVERTRELFAKSLGYNKPPQQGDYAIAQRFLTGEATGSAPYVIFLHATTRDDKHWPESHWRRLVELMQPTGLGIKLPWGAEHEHQRAMRIAAGQPHVQVLPKLSLAEVASELANATAVISVDTGLSHLAAALDRPNITIFGPTDPGLIGGYGQNQQQQVSPTGKTGDITANAIFNALQDILQRANGET